MNETLHFKKFWEIIMFDFLNEWWDIIMFDFLKEWYIDDGN